MQQRGVRDDPAGTIGHNLNEPERSAFWGAVQARDKIGTPLSALSSGAKP